jgi:hypothetical protein
MACPLSEILADHASAPCVVIDLDQPSFTGYSGRRSKPEPPEQAIDRARSVRESRSLNSAYVRSDQPK